MANRIVRYYQRHTMSMEKSENSRERGIKYQRELEFGLTPGVETFEYN